MVMLETMMYLIMKFMNLGDIHKPTGVFNDYKLKGVWK